MSELYTPTSAHFLMSSSDNKVGAVELDAPGTGARAPSSNVVNLNVSTSTRGTPKKDPVLSPTRREAESYPPSTVSSRAPGPRSGPLTGPPWMAYPLSVYWSVSWILGFKDKYSFLCFSIFGGALLGFCLAKSQALNPSLTPSITTPGQFFWYNLPKFKVNYFLHIYLSFFGGIAVGGQFVPSIRRRAVALHRINGYFSLFCLIPGNIVGAIVGAKSFGGEINAQAAYYVVTFMITVSGILGLINVKKETREHRKWMLRMVTYFCSVITGRLVALIAIRIVDDIGTFFSVWRCDEMMYLVNPTTPDIVSAFPQCFAPNVDPSTVYIAVQASLSLAKINSVSATRVASGMGLWVGIIVHVIGVEIYIRLTDEMNRKRYGYVLEPAGYDGEGQALWVYEKEKQR